MFRASRDFTTALLCRGFPDFDRLEILGKDALAASFVVAGKTPIRINPAIAALPVLAALEPVDLVEAVAFEPISPARLADASGEPDSMCRFGAAA